MGKFYNNSKFKQRRKDLRKTQTDSEKILWNLLRNKKCLGLKFHRQYSIGPYILDFYCPKIKLSIEADGGQHNTDDFRSYDLKRRKFIENYDITELRFWNNEIAKDISGVYEKILDECSHLLKTK